MYSRIAAGEVNSGLREKLDRPILKVHPSDDESKLTNDFGEIMRKKFLLYLMNFHEHRKRSVGHERIRNQNVNILKERDEINSATL